MVQAMATHSTLSNTNLRSLQMIDLAGTTILPEIVKLCMDKLGVAPVAATYGMTEGNTISMSDMREMPYTRHDIPEIIPCGKVTLGARVKICAPRSQKVVKRGEIGELHIGGLQVSRGYLDRRTPEFYKEDDMTWLVTGDQVRLDEEGLLHILGRYIDLIIRRGRIFLQRQSKGAWTPLKVSKIPKW